MTGEEYIQHPLETAYKLAQMNIDESTIMGVERNSALMILGYLYKVKFIDFKETTQNHLSIWLTDEGENIKLSN